jgi:1-phosphofructokinase/tagatose 6-phosphate kinase
MNPTLQKTLRFSGLAIDAVNRTALHRLDASGKGVNVSRVLTQLGKSCVHLTQLGGAFRGMFLDFCAQDGLAVAWVESGSLIRFCYTLINDADHSVTELVEEAEPVAPETEESLKKAYLRLLPECTWVIVSGSKAAGFSDNLVPFMVKCAKETGKQVILDLRGRDLENSLAYKPDILKPNLLEFAGTFAPELLKGPGIPADCKDRIKTICLDLADRYGCRIILTRGNEPVWLAESGTFSEYAFTPVSPVNTTGSGDAFTAGFAGALSGNASLAEAVAEGVRCGALNAGLFKPGVIR